MIIEYYIKNDEYKKQLNKLDFTTSNNLEINKRSKKTEGKNNFLLRLTSKVEGREGAKALSEVNQRVEEMLDKNGYTFRLLTDEASQYYVKQLYPIVCEFETKLRKFLHSVLFDVDKITMDALHKKLKKAKIIDGDKADILNYNFLESAELGSIQEFLFSNDELYKAVDDYKKDPNNRFASRDELISFVKTSDKNTIWEELFAKDFSDSILPKKFKELKDYRNDVMHFHEINDARYEAAFSLFREVIKDLDKQINKGIVFEVAEDKIQLLTNNTSYLVGALSGLTKLTNPLSLYETDKLINMTNALRMFSSSISPQTMAVLEGVMNFGGLLKTTSLFNTSIDYLALMKSIGKPTSIDSSIYNIDHSERLIDVEETAPIINSQAELKNDKKEED